METAVQQIPDSQLREDLWRPLRTPGRAWTLWTLSSALVVVAGLVAWGYQIHTGIGVVGKTRPMMWALYITNFVFWIGISHAGTLISAILRLTEAEWRKPVTRAAEAITVFCLMIGGMFPLIHLGRVWIFYYLVPYPNQRFLWPNFRSPLVWDLTAILTYLTGSTIFLFLPLIPDMAHLRDHVTGWRRTLYRALALGWTGSDREWHALERAMKLMAGIILAVAVSVHTVVSWDFAMAIAPMWHSTIFGPYFVAGAIFSGIAALIIAMAVIRKTMRLEAYLTLHHFDNLAKLLLLMSLLWTYFTIAENLTVWYGNTTAELNVLEEKIYGSYAPFFWAMVVCNAVIPFVLLSIRRLRTLKTSVIASIAVVIGMWLERFLIVLTTTSRPRLPAAWGGMYHPTWVELTITAATFAAMLLLYLLFAKVFPIIAIWEFKSNEEVGH